MAKGKLRKAAKSGFAKAVEVFRSDDPEFDEDDIDIEVSTTKKSKARTPSQVQRDEGVGYAEAVKISDAEKARKLAIIQRYLEKPDASGDTDVELRKMLIEYGYDPKNLPKAAALTAAAPKPRTVSAAHAMKFKVMPDEKLVMLQRYFEKPDAASEDEVRKVLKEYGYGRELPKKVVSGVAGKPRGAGFAPAPLKEYVGRALQGQVNRQMGAFKAEDFQAEVMKVLQEKKVPKEVMEKLQALKPKDLQKYLDNPEKLTKLTSAYVAPASETYTGKAVGGAKKFLGGLLGSGETAASKAELAALGIKGQSGVARLGRTLSKGSNVLGLAALGGSAYLNYADAKKRSAEAEDIRTNAAATAMPAHALRERMDTEARVASSRFIFEKQDPEFVERVMAGLFGAETPTPENVEMSIADLVKPRGQPNRTNVVEEVDAFLASLQ